MWLKKCSLKKNDQSDFKKTTQQTITGETTEGTDGDACKIKIRPNQRSLLIRGSPDIQLLMQPPVEATRLSASSSHDQGATERHHLQPCGSLVSVCLLAHLRSCTIYLYTHLSTSPVFLVFVSVKKYYINIYNH